LEGGGVFDIGCDKCKGYGGDDVDARVGHDDTSAVRKGLVDGRGSAEVVAAMEIDSGDGAGNLPGICGIVGVDEPLKMGYPPIKSMAPFSSGAGRSVASGRRSSGPRGGRLTSGGTSGHVESGGLSSWTTREA